MIPTDRVKDILIHVIIPHIFFPTKVNIENDGDLYSL
jgi:hypothetical protein